MSHSPTVIAIEKFAGDAIKQKNPSLYLQKLGPLHVRWHTTSLRDTLGFLLFHWHVVGEFRRCRADKIWQGGVKPFSLAEWKGFKWPYNVSLKVKAGDYDSLANFSRALENWHNNAHMAVMNATGEDLMNPATNVLLRNFWRLHYFIDDRFLQALAAFDPSGTPKQKVARIETKHHASLGRV